MVRCVRAWWLGAAVMAVFVGACAATTPDPCAGLDRCVAVVAGDEPTAALQRALLEVPEGGTVALGPGVYRLRSELTLTRSGVTIRGAGRGRTVLDFSGAVLGGGAFGIKIDAVAGVRVEGLTIYDAPGDALFVVDSTDVVIRELRVEWRRGPHPDNGRYGIYPVRCERVLVEDTVVRGASDAGIYVGESRRVVVRDNLVYENVSGIQIENTFDSEVYGNVASANTAGIFVFDLPGKETQPNGGRHRVHDNRIVANNVDNFADPEAIAGIIPAGSGLLIMATREVEAFANELRDNGTVQLGVVSFMISGRAIEDPRYFPYPTTVYLHDNTFAGGGDDPDVSRQAGQLLALLFGAGPIPEIVYDGIVTDPVAGTPDPVANPLHLCLEGNRRADGSAVAFANLQAGRIDPADPGTIDPANVVTDPTPYRCTGPSQPPVVLEGLE